MWAAMNTDAIAELREVLKPYNVPPKVFNEWAKRWIVDAEVSKRVKASEVEAFNGQPDQLMFLITEDLRQQIGKILVENMAVNLTYRDTERDELVIKVVTRMLRVDP